MEDRRIRTISPLAGTMSLRCLSGLSGHRTIFPYYHVVSDKELPHMKHLYAHRSESQFERDLEWLLRYFEPISIEDYLEDLKDGRKEGSLENRKKNSRRRRMVLSFDDGLIECHQFIVPLLKSKGIPAIFFLNNDFIDNRGLFYRYKASVLIEHLNENSTAKVKAAEYMEIPSQQLKDAILMITHRQLPLLDALAMHVDLDWAVYLRDQPVYMSDDQIKHLIKIGFHIGAHSFDHPQFHSMEEKKMVAHVSKSVSDLQNRFGCKPACFAFPFTSDGVPERVIDEILDEGIAEVLFGTAGLKKTGKAGFIQRIPMEVRGLSAQRVLKSEYLFYLLKGPLGRNTYFKDR